MAREDYHNARVAGRKAYRADVQAGRYPYLPALDDMISYSETQGEYPLGRVDIPLNLIVETLTGLAHSLRIKICLEGVESEKIRLFIMNYRADYHQGFLYAGPISFSTLMGLLQTSNQV